jgi:beta-phosphoglucomutase
MTTPKAFLFDLNGTMIDDMGYHLHAWYDIIVGELGADLTIEEVKDQMYGKSQEILVRIFGDGKFSAEELDNITFRKERQYRQAFRPHLDLLPGLFNFLERAREKKIKMAIGSASIPYNIDFVVDNLKIRHYFEAIVSADDVSRSKPDPETFIKAARRLRVDPRSCVVFEDVPKGVEAAFNAGMKAVVVTTTHEMSEFQRYNNIIGYISDFSELAPMDVWASPHIAGNS